MSRTTRRTFTCAGLEEHHDGSATLMVWTQGQQMEIRLAPHVWADIGFRLYQRYANTRAPWSTSVPAETVKQKRRSRRMEDVA